MDKQYGRVAIDAQDVNILLIGETGVGKSTFINAFANYMEYDEFQVAQTAPVRCVLPSSFTVTDENMEERLIKIGQDKNENDEIGASATQRVRSYVFPLSQYGIRVRFIDTPGVGDTRGINQDDVNLENILAYISDMDYLHAICFLLKPNNSRVTVYFEYCIKQLLSRLDKSACDNIIFLFTNSRSTFYSPGDTAPALKKILKQIGSKPPHADIKFGKDNVFCLDNEAFRFMVCCKEGIDFDRAKKESFSQSWDHSVSECWRMIEFITGSGNRTVKLVPHKVQDTISVNNARRIIIQLSQPLADIADLINDNINLLGRHNVTLSNENVSMTDLRKRLYVPVVNLRHKELKQPTTVCTNAKCSEIYMVADKKKYHYKQRCHDPCYLTNVPAEMIGSPELVYCYAMLPTKKCRECDCDFSAHMHIYYLTETYEDKITDTGIQSQITDRETAVKATKKLIEEIELRKDEYEAEKEVIIKTMAKFAHFLQYNAIAPYNDAYKGYIEYLIDREKSHGKDADAQLINNYNDLLKRYDEEKVILEGALSMSNKSTTSIVKSDDVFNAVQALFRLKNTGTKIKELYEKQTDARKTEHDRNTEYVLDAAQVKKKPNKRNTDGKSDELSEKEKLLRAFPELEKYFLQMEQTKNKEKEKKSVDNFPDLKKYLEQMKNEEKEKEMADVKTELSYMSQLLSKFFPRWKSHDGLPNEDDDAEPKRNLKHNKPPSNHRQPNRVQRNKYQKQFDDSTQSNEDLRSFGYRKKQIPRQHDSDEDDSYQTPSKEKSSGSSDVRQPTKVFDDSEYVHSFNYSNKQTPRSRNFDEDGLYRSPNKEKSSGSSDVRQPTKVFDDSQYVHSFNYSNKQTPRSRNFDEDGLYRSPSKEKSSGSSDVRHPKKVFDATEYVHSYNYSKQQTPRSRNFDEDGLYQAPSKKKSHVDKSSGDKDEYKESFGRPSARLSDPYEKYKDNFDDPHESKGDGPYKNIAKLKGRREVPHKQEEQGGDKEEYPGPSGEPFDFYNYDNNECDDYFQRAEGKKYEDDAGVYESISKLKDRVGSKPERQRRYEDANNCKRENESNKNESDLGKKNVSDFF